MFYIHIHIHFKCYSFFFVRLLLLACSVAVAALPWFPLRLVRVIIQAIALRIHVLINSSKKYKIQFPFCEIINGWQEHEIHRECVRCVRCFFCGYFICRQPTEFVARVLIIIHGVIFDLRLFCYLYRWITTANQFFCSQFEYDLFISSGIALVPSLVLNNFVAAFAVPLVRGVRVILNQFNRHSVRNEWLWNLLCVRHDFVTIFFIVHSLDIHALQ